MKFNKFLIAAAALVAAFLYAGAAAAQGPGGGGPGPGPPPSPWIILGPQISYSGGCALIPSTFAGGCNTSTSTPQLGVNRLYVGAPTAANSSFNIIPGTAPTSPVNGDLWPTSSGWFARAGGVTYALTGAGSASFTATQPLMVTFPSVGVVNYALNYNASLTKDGSNNLGINLANTNRYSLLQTVDLGTGAEPAANTGTGFNLYGADGAADHLEVTAFNNSVSGAAAIFDGRTSLGTRASPTTVTTGTLLASFEGKGYDSSVWTGTGSSFHSYAEGTWTSISHPGEACMATTAAAATATTDWWCVHNDGGTTLGSPTGGDEGAGTVNLAGSLYNNGTAPTGTGAYVRATSPSLTTPTLGAAIGTSLALGGATIGSNALAVTGATQLTGATTITSASASALAVGLNGATNPAFVVNDSTSSQAAGLSVTGAATGATVALAAIDSGLNTNLTINAKGSGTIGIGTVSTGAVTIAPALTLSAALTYGGVTLSNAVTGTGNMVLSASPTFTGTVGGTNVIPLSVIVQDATGYSFLGNTGSSAANYAPFTPGSLTAKASPGANDLLIIADVSASGQLKQTTVSAVSAAGSVATFNGLTGAVTSNVTSQSFCPSGNGCTTALAGGSTTTYTPTSGTTNVIAECEGGGGGGGGAANSTGNGGGSGGGAGSYSRAILSKVTAALGLTVSNGAGGTAGSQGNNNGGAGGATSLGTVVTISITTPAVVSLTAHGLYVGQPVTFETTSALPTGLTAGTTYYVISAGLTANAFEISTSIGGSAVNTSGSQSGTQSVVILLCNGGGAGNGSAANGAAATGAGGVVGVGTIAVAGNPGTSINTSGSLITVASAGSRGGDGHFQGGVAGKVPAVSGAGANASGCGNGGGGGLSYNALGDQGGGTGSAGCMFFTELTN